MRSAQRIVSRVLLVALVATAGLAPVTSAQALTNPAAQQTTLLSQSPVGTWNVTVTIEGVPPFPAKFQFTPSGVAFVAGRGSGVWWKTGDATFSFAIAEGNWTAEGVYVGWIDVRQSPTLNGNTFTSSGVSTVKDVNDTAIQVANVTMTATRV